MAQNAVRKSPGIAGILLPKPPPTSGAMTRSLSSGIPATSDERNRTMWGFCVVFQSAQLVAALHLATHRAFPSPWE
jgi:hypothetical protein